MLSQKKHLTNKLILLKSLSHNKNIKSINIPVEETKKQIILTNKFDDEILTLGKNVNSINYNVRYIYANFVIRKNNSYILNYNLTDEEKLWINFNNMVVLPWTFLSKNTDDKLYEFISLLIFENGMYTYIDENIKDKFIYLINRIGLKPLE